MRLRTLAVVLAWSTCFSLSQPIANAQDMEPTYVQGSPSEGRREKLIKIMRARSAARRGNTATSATAVSVASADVKVTSDIAYGTDPLQRLDIYAPKVAKDPLPTCLRVWWRSKPSLFDGTLSWCSFG